MNITPSKGQAVVPCEPTEAMLAEGAEAIERIVDAMQAREASYHPEDMPDYDAGDEAKAAWKAMIAAASSTPAPTVVPDALREALRTAIGEQRKERLDERGN